MSWLGLSRGRVSPMCLVEVETGSGLIGHGITYLAESTVVAQAVNAVAAPIATGMSALATEKVWSALWWGLTASAQTGYGANAISAVDLALWDIKGQALGLPVWQLLGAAHDKVPVYATIGLPNLEPAQVADMTRRLVEKGWKAVKIQVGRPGLDQRDRAKPLDAIIEEDVARIAAIRETVGEGIGIAIDGASRFDLAHAVALAERAAPYKIAWYEEPVLQNDIRAMTELRRRTAIPISVGQNEGQLYRFRDMLIADSVDMIQPNVSIIGGITVGVKAAALAASFTVPIASGGGSCPFHNAHLQGGVANGGKVEYQASATSAYEPLFDGLPKIVDGQIALSDKPGFGFRPRREAVAEFAVK
jgi:L-alanine-DL-glutamate epimerase-like enolase superfamily enzyme